jgi:hypothetical protein
MSSFFDDLEAQLRGAAQTRAGASAPAGGARRGRRRLRGWLRAAPVLAAVLVALAVAGAALLLVGHRGQGGAAGSRPPGGGIGSIIAHTPKRQLHRELAYVMAATQAVHNSKACRLRQPVGVTYAQGSPGSDLLSILGVLRRPATPADHLDLSRLGPPVPDVYRAYIRRALSADGVSYYIIPARFDRAASVPSDRCFELQTQALNRGLPKIPTSLRQPTREIQAALIAWERSIAAHAPRDTICFVSLGHSSTGASCGATPQAIKAGQGAGNDDGTYSGVVPDGVATITLILPATAGHPVRSFTVRVTGNVYAVRTDQNPLHAFLHPPTVIWRSADGRVLKRISPPTNTAAARNRVCKQVPVPCLVIGASSGGTSSASGAAPVRTRQRTGP